MTETQLDINRILDAAPDEVIGVLWLLRAGMIDGKIYFARRGECGCLVGSIAMQRGEIGRGKIVFVRPDCWRSAELFFFDIRPGDVPSTNPVAAQAETWILEWLDRNYPGVAGEMMEQAT